MKGKLCILTSLLGLALTMASYPLSAQADTTIRNLWLVKVDGSEAKPITHFDPALPWDWDLSPDGKHVVVRSLIG